MVETSSLEDESASIVTSTEYNTNLTSTMFGNIVSTTNAEGITTRYYYDNANGRLLASVNEDSAEGLCYTYDFIGRLIGVMPATYVSSESYNAVTNAENVSYTYNSHNLLSTISTASTTYTFEYDAFGNSTEIGVGNNALASYEYNDYNGKLIKTTYGNDFVIEYVYNHLELLSELWYTVNGIRYKAFEYEYTSDGKLYKYIDNTECVNCTAGVDTASHVCKSKVTVYKYDDNDRLVSFTEYTADDMYHDFSAAFSYNQTNGMISSISYDINYMSGTALDTAVLRYIYTYDTDGTACGGAFLKARFRPSFCNARIGA